jgi:hypothetical protein
MNNLLYLKESNCFSKAYYKEGTTEINSIRSELNHLAVKHLFTVESYRKSIKKILPVKNKIPLYFSDKLFLIYVKTLNKEMYQINLKEVAKVCFENDFVVVVFNTGLLLKLNTSINSVKSVLKNAAMISNYINNLHGL